MVDGSVQSLPPNTPGRWAELSLAHHQSHLAAGNPGKICPGHLQPPPRPQLGLNIIIFITLSLSLSLFPYLYTLFSVLTLNYRMAGTREAAED